MMMSDHTARSPTDVESELEKLRAISTDEMVASTSRRTSPFSWATKIVSLTLNDHPERVPPFSKLNVESSMLTSPEPETSNKAPLEERDNWLA